MQDEAIQIVRGDCFESMQAISNSSADLILLDPPYGTIKGMVVKGWDKATASWDVPLCPSSILDVADRVLKQQRKCIIFSAQPYTTQLISAETKNMCFGQSMIWEKNHFAHGLAAKSAPVSYYEDVLVFFKKYDTRNDSPLRTYFASVKEFIGLPLREITQAVGRKAEHCFYLTSTQFGLPTQETYAELTDTYALTTMPNYKTYGELVKLGASPVFNLPDGKGHKSNIFKYKKDSGGYHPTQKPIALLEDLIQTYTNKGELVIDFTMGSGSTGVACARTGRRFIGVEADANFYAVAKERLQQEVAATDLGCYYLQGKE